MFGVVVYLRCVACGLVVYCVGVGSAVGGEGVVIMFRDKLGTVLCMEDDRGFTVRYIHPRRPPLESACVCC